MAGRRFHDEIARRGKLYEMDFPTYEQQEIPVTDDMESAFGVRPVNEYRAEWEKNNDI